MQNNDQQSVSPLGELALQTLAMPKDTNANGDIFGGWLLSQMDLAAGITTKKIAKGRAVTVAINNVVFLLPVKVGSIVSCYAKLIEIGRSSMKINVEVWMTGEHTDNQTCKAAEGLFIFVAIDDKGDTRVISQ
ncbi:MAG: acyl-CoA thioesterase [SAR86 cluster bacterium]|uniref:Acyl-CoA thioesterase n=1 Tax=SAR86 cluster bacterium TaxID=2030880 RepID=A0A2A4MTC8_9GAMM|nr:MAG: acyl-CoA thioesterase [SAR86 cluster bacterium]